jgi:hypothetical protein
MVALFVIAPERDVEVNNPPFRVIPVSDEFNIKPPDKSWNKETMYP